jgi:hypothetical protein
MREKESQTSRHERNILGDFEYHDRRLLAKVCFVERLHHNCRAVQILDFVFGTFSRVSPKPGMPS